MTNLEPTWAAIWVGGKSTRMGGAPKGLLLAPDGVPIIERTIGLMRRALPHGHIVFAGEQPAYAAPGIEQIADDPAGVGPIGGLCAALERAQAAGAQQLLAVSCDLPHLELALLLRLLSYAPDAWVVAPKAGPTKWQPLFARYRVDAALAATQLVIGRGERSLQGVLGELAERRVELPLSALEEAQLADWDSPSDMTSAPR